MKSVTGRYIFWDMIIINIIEYANGDCLFLPDHAPNSWCGTKERILKLIEKGELVYLEPYKPITPKKYIPTLELIK